MKKICMIFILIGLFFCDLILAQSPKSFKYQTVVRDINGTVITKQNVSLQISIIQDTSVGGTIVYSETFTNIKPTNLGMVNLDIGKGTIVTGNFNKIDWGSHKFYISINMDPNGGSNYQAMGTSELLSVPYALYAETAGNSNLNLTGTGSTSVTGTYPNYIINGKFQSLNSSNDTIYLSNGGYVKLPYTAGTGIGFTGTIINNTMPNATHTGDATGTGTLKVIALQGNAISSSTPNNGQALVWNGSMWSPSLINSNTYYAGAGLSLNGNTFIHTLHTGDATGQTNLTVVAIQGNPILTTVPILNQILSWNGSAWSPITNTGQVYYAGTGLSIAGNTFYHSAHTGDAIGQTSLTVVAFQGEAISTIAPTINQILYWDGSAWTPVTGGTGGVSGFGKTNFITFWTGSSAISSDTNLYWDNANKRLGIGTKTPRQSLGISGNLSFIDQTGAGYIYRGSIPFIHNYGITDMFAGMYAGNLNITGTDNTGVGYGALYSNSSGANNSAFGSTALYFNTTGTQNVAIGSSALYNNDAGIQNVAIGTQALYWNNGNNASCNTAIGYQALYYNTFAYNTAIGKQALYQNTSGTNNIAIGYKASYTNTQGQNNTVTGNSALFSNSTGSNNTAMGANASGYTTGTSNSTFGFYTEYQGTSCSYTTAIGANALSSNTTGSYNTGLGYLADVSTSNLTNATTIGYGAIVNASYKVRIGNTAVSVIEGQVSFSSASDMRFKKNIKDIGVGLDFVMKLRPVEYEVNTGDTRLNYGFIAQELLQIVGENNTLVNIGGDDAKTLSVRHTDLIAPVVKAIQEQQAIIQQQQTINYDLQKQINDLKTQISTLIKK